MKDEQLLGVLGLWSEIDRKSEKRENELFGFCKGPGGDYCPCATCHPPDDESEIILSSLSHKQKLAKIKRLRASKSKRSKGGGSPVLACRVIQTKIALNRLARL